MGQKVWQKKVVRHLPVIRKGSKTVLKEAGALTLKTIKIPIAFVPLTQLLTSAENIDQTQLAYALDQVFESLYHHPLNNYTYKLTVFLRNNNIIPNEQTTESLIRFVVNQIIERSPLPIPEPVINEFWTFFHELFSEPELKGLMELNLDVTRIVLGSYEPLLVDLINLIKETRRFNQIKISELLAKIRVVRNDLKIIRRQIKAIRYIKPFFQTNPRDFSTQAQIVAQMVREFGPFFIKMAQAAAANSDFLPDEISKELAVFQQDVEPMNAHEVREAFHECFQKHPGECYFGFDEERPLRSGSIGSVYLARKPIIEEGREVLKPVIVKVGRHNLDREFLMGKTVLGVAIISSQYWAPHSKLAPFLEALKGQVDEFVQGFQKELNFEEEARIQKRFARRSKESTMWNVPQVYSYSRRILEMEYMEGAVNIHQAFAGYEGKKKERFQRKLANRFVYTTLLHMWVYNEFHGDLHPGNILVSPDGQLHLIDWGNAVNMNGKWQPVWDYVVGALAADADRLADALINISTNPVANRLRREEIRLTLKETIKSRGISPLDKNLTDQLLSYANLIYDQCTANMGPLASTLFTKMRTQGIKGMTHQIQTGYSTIKMMIVNQSKELFKELHERFQLVMHLMSNTQHLGVVIKSEYMHLSRSLFALAGTYAGLYEGLPKYLMATDLLKSFSMFPVMLLVDRIQVKRKASKDQFLQNLPVPMMMRRKNPSEKYAA